MGENEADTTGQNLTGTGQKSVGEVWGSLYGGSPSVPGDAALKEYNALPVDERRRASVAFVRERLRRARLR